MFVYRYYKKRYKFFDYLRAIIMGATIIFLIILIFNRIKSDNIASGQNEAESLWIASKDVVAIIGTNGENEVLGSGVIVGKDGLILTNEHLVGDMTECVVIVDSKNKKNASVVWSNPQVDLAILKINYTFEREATLAECSYIDIAEDVYAVGNPVSLDFEKSVTRGIISGLNRNLEFEENGKRFYLNNLIQFDANTNFGNSGGALINKSGQLIGICTVKITSAEGMSFAVPAGFIKPILEEIKRSNTFNEPKLNMTVYDKYSVGKINNSIVMDKGIYVAGVESNCNAEKSGLRPGDIIEYIDSNEIIDMLDFRSSLYEKKVGEKARFIIKRDGKYYSVEVILE